MKKLSAPIDGKNVSIDWIDDIFDGCFCTECGKQSLGFVNEKPVYAYWSDNRICWKPIEKISAKETLDEIKNRLLKFENEDSELFSEIYVVGNLFLSQYFYWKI